MKHIELPMDVNAIMEILPHRYPFLLVDRVTQLDAESVTAYKNVTFNEPFFPGHFPGKPVMPGVLILEGMAQTGCIYASVNGFLPEGSIFLFAGVDKARFRRVVHPGDKLVYRLTLLKHRAKVVKMTAQSFVDDQLVTEAELRASYE